jgi:hypothetical protein
MNDDQLKALIEAYALRTEALVQSATKDRELTTRIVWALENIDTKLEMITIMLKKELRL